ncbi:hypothetical protein [Stenotrophobium rhamnosiphilum]|uniref:Uncharacterized protein n=1 Tax=Stenotrophobium rhamnosiphilum TaxID=2029166 RepID=A0A2T5ME30_9GAMM|nr:hypothetical protein [Stenotrophobium rhamnosiphilum]PTU30844.1 hypothetical protein CJD38_11070 [Stenotrophobium rhamnosiphilum]
MYRANSVSGPLLRAYDDTVLIALALSAFLKPGSGSFNISAPGFALGCAVHTALDPDNLRALLRRVAVSTVAAEEDLVSGCMETDIEITARVDGIDVVYRAWLVERSRQKSMRWNPSVVKALALLKEHSALYEE